MIIAFNEKKTKFTKKYNFFFGINYTMNALFLHNVTIT